MGGSEKKLKVREVGVPKENIFCEILVELTSVISWDRLHDKMYPDCSNLIPDKFVSTISISFTFSFQHQASFSSDTGKTERQSSSEDKHASEGSMFL